MELKRVAPGDVIVEYVGRESTALLVLSWPDHLRYECVGIDVVHLGFGVLDRLVGAACEEVVVLRSEGR